MDETSSPIYRLVVSCLDQPGIIHAISGVLYDVDANIVKSDQYTSNPVGGTFFLRMEFTTATFDEEAFAAEFSEVAERFSMQWGVARKDVPKSVAIMVSKVDHCLLDLLWRIASGQLNATVTKVVSNHPDLARVVEPFGVPYYHIPVARETKLKAEHELLELLAKDDLLVLARYMQILTGEFLDRFSRPVINVHHALLPAFAGAAPYERASKSGVKLIGATSHYVTEELDAGPIIEQDVARVSHRDTLATLKQRGADIERIVLSRAVRWHCDDLVLVHGNRTVVF